MARQKKEQPEEQPGKQMSNLEKIKALKDKVNRQLKTNALQTFSEDDDLSVNRLSSGILSLDLILGKGKNGYGWPVGRVSEVYGPESAGKSSVLLSTIATAQKQGKTVALIDAEHALNLEYAKDMGVNIDELLLCQPDTGEQAYDVAEILVQEVDLVLIDSVAAILPKAEEEGEMGQQFMGLAARLNNKFMRKIIPKVGEHNCTLILVNQIREKMVMMGNPETTTGGRGIKYACSVRLDVRKVDDVLDNGDKVGQIIKFKTIKNKTAAPHKTAEGRLDFGQGFNRSFCLVELGVMKGLIVSAGAWTKYKGETFNGKAKLVERIMSDEEFANDLEKEILKVI